MSNPFRYFNSSPEVIRLVVMMYVRYPLSLRNVEDLLAERGVDISHETVRFWWNRFGPMFAAEIRKRRVAHMRTYPQWRWHLDEVFVKVNGKLCYLWRAIDHEGEVLEAVVTAKRNKAAALKLLKKIMKKYGAPRSIVTDGLRAYSAAMNEIGVAAERHEVGGRLNNRAENSHQPFRRRERAMQRFRSPKTLQKFSSVHAQVHNQFNQERHLVTRQVYKQRRSIALAEWRALQGKASLASGRVALRVGECCYSDDARGILRATAFGQHWALSLQTSQSNLLAR
jgi:putative transposase